MESESGKPVAGWSHSARNRARWFLHTSVLPDLVHLPQTGPGHPDRIWISFAQYDLGLFWGKKGTKLDVGSQIIIIIIIMNT